MRIPPGFTTVVPYLFLDGADAFVAFARTAFGAEETGRSLRADGAIANCELRIGTAALMVSEASVDYPARPGSYYLYVEDAHATMARATAAGATQVMAVGDMPYGDRQGGVSDPTGNLWWISERLVDGGYH